MADLPAYKNDALVATTLLQAAYGPTEATQFGGIQLSYVGIPPAFDPAYMEKPETAMACIRACPATLDLMQHPTREMVFEGLRTAATMADSRASLSVGFPNPYDDSALPLPNDSIIEKIANPTLEILHTAHDLGYAVDSALEKCGKGLDEEAIIKTKAEWDTERLTHGRVYVPDETQDAKEHLEAYGKLPDKEARTDIEPVWLLTATLDVFDYEDSYTKECCVVLDGSLENFSKDISQMVSYERNISYSSETTLEKQETGQIIEIQVGDRDRSLTLQFEPIGIPTETFNAMRESDEILHPGEATTFYDLEEKGDFLSQQDIYKLSESEQTEFVGESISLDIDPNGVDDKDDDFLESVQSAIGEMAEEVQTLDKSEDVSVMDDVIDETDADVDSDNAWSDADVDAE